jgi:hypothetical protein
MFYFLFFSLVIIKDKNKERQIKHRTKMKRERMKKRPNLGFRAPQVAFDQPLFRFHGIHNILMLA